MLTNHILGDETFTELATEWDALARQSMTDTPFQSLAYQQAWWRNLGPAAASLHTLTARHADGKLAAIGSFYLMDGSLYFNGCIEETDYLDLIARAEEAEAGWTAVLRHLLHPDFPAWQIAQFCNVPAASPTRSILAALASQEGLDYHEEVIEVCPSSPCPPPSTPTWRCWTANSAARSAANCAGQTPPKPICARSGQRMI
jgi:hypothetical protein